MTASSSLLKPHLHVLNLGIAPYSPTLELQKELHQKVVDTANPFYLLLCSHPPVITLGTSGSLEQLQASPEKLRSLGIEVLKTGRGGKITYHGPEQLVGYPIMDLKLLRRDVSWYLRQLEEVIIRTLAAFGVVADRDSDRTGVWIQNSVKQLSEPAKIASIGVKLSRWCSYHGFSVNLLPCSEMFSLIDPCGYPKLPITSLTEECEGTIELSSFSRELISQFHEVFGLTVVSIADEQESQETNR